MYFGGKQVVVVVNRNKYVCSVFFEVYRYFKENKAYCFQLTVSYRKFYNNYTTFLIWFTLIHSTCFACGKTVGFHVALLSACLLVFTTLCFGSVYISCNLYWEFPVVSSLLLYVAH